MKKNLIKLFAIASASSLALAACATGDNAASDVVKLNVGATPMPHAEILRFIDDNLAADAGIDLEITEYTDYVQPNVELDAGGIDANYFQHIPYLEDQLEQNPNFSFDHGEGIHNEPMGIYSEQYTSLDQVQDGDTVIIPNDPENGSRALQLLAANGLLVAPAGTSTLAVADFTGNANSNPKNLQITEEDAATIPANYAHAALGVINTNFALEANIDATKYGLAFEGEDVAYPNVLVWNTDSDKLDAIKKLDELLHSQEVKDFINENYNGAVKPVF